jgi:hypothetical protein
MKNTITKILILCGIISIITACEKSACNCDKQQSTIIGTWVNAESFALTYFDFINGSVAKFCNRSGNYYSENLLNYRLLENSIEFRWLGENENRRHKITFGGGEYLISAAKTDVQTYALHFFEIWKCSALCVLVYLRWIL